MRSSRVPLPTCRTVLFPPFLSFPALRHIRANLLHHPASLPSLLAYLSPPLSAFSQPPLRLGLPYAPSKGFKFFSFFSSSLNF
jgi:hypothetical protein